MDCRKESMRSWPGASCMTVNLTGVDPEHAFREKTERIRDAIEGDVGRLWSAIAAIVGAIEPGASRARRMQRAEEVLGEVVCRALSSPGSYEPGRPVVP